MTYGLYKSPKVSVARMTCSGIAPRDRMSILNPAAPVGEEVETLEVAVEVLVEAPEVGPPEGVVDLAVDWEEVAVGLTSE